MAKNVVNCAQRPPGGCSAAERMQQQMKRFFALLFSIIFAACAFSFVPSGAAGGTTAQDITANCKIRVGGKDADPKLTDKSEFSAVELDNKVISIAASEPIGGIYIRFGKLPGAWTLNLNDGTELKCGKYGILHEYVSISGDARMLSMSFPGKFYISEINILSKGDKLPAFVQNWSAPQGKCDVLLNVCHAGDESLFFAGILPDAVDRGASVQVCYFTNHWETTSRTHELLNALWTSGITRYPVISPYPDTMLTRNEAEALKGLQLRDSSITYESIVEYETELIRRFQPEIVITHDENGEYGHGAHMLASHAVRDAVTSAPDSSKYPSSANKYGTWDVPKTYIHLLEDNAVDFDSDRPLEAFGGMTAFKVSQEAMKCHASQKDTTYYQWLFSADSSAQLATYSPRKFGLWRSTVGDDTVKKDFYEHTALSGGAAEPTPEPTAEPTEEPTEPAETQAPVEPTATPEAITPEPTAEPTADPAEPAEQTAQPAETQNPSAAVDDKLPSPVLIALIILALLAAAGVAIHFIIKYN